jgi:hypothetical protein
MCHREFKWTELHSDVRGRIGRRAGLLAPERENAVKILRRLAAVIAFTAVLVFGSFPFLFAGVPYPDCCAVTTANRRTGVLFFLPRTWQRFIGGALLVWYVVLAWRERMDDERKGAKQAAELEEYRARLRAQGGHRSSV